MHERCTCDIDRLRCTLVISLFGGMSLLSVVSLYVRSHFAMNRCGRSKPQFLARLPSSDLFQWLDTQVGNSPGTRDKLSGTKSVGTIDMRVRDRLPTVVAAGVTCVESSEGRADRKKRSDMPVVRKASKGDAAKVRKVALDPKLRAMAQSELTGRRYVRTYN